MALKEDKRKIFDKFREEIVKLSSDTWYANGRVPQLTLKFDNIGGGRNWVVDLSPNGKLRIIFENLYRWDNSNQLFKRTQADTLKKKFETNPALKEALWTRWKKSGNWGRYNKPKEWMPVHKEIIKILNVLIT